MLKARYAVQLVQPPRHFEPTLAVRYEQVRSKFSQLLGVTTDAPTPNNTQHNANTAMAITIGFGTSRALAAFRYAVHHRSLYRILSRNKVLLTHPLMPT